MARKNAADNIGVEVVIVVCKRKKMSLVLGFVIEFYCDR